MSHSLPKSPDLEQLRKQAKDLVKAHRARDKDVCGVLRHLRKFDGASDEQVMAGELTLSDAQHAIARQYGFEQWSQLKHHVESAAGAPADPRGVRREDNKVWIEGVAPLRWGKSGECTFAGALSAALAVTSRPVSYSDLMGYSGLAFRVRWYRRFDEPAWCPSSPVGEFSEEILAVTEAIGWRIHQESRMASEQKDMSAYAPSLRQAIDAGRPVVGYPDSDLNVAVCYGYEQAGEETTFLWNAYGRDELRVPAGGVGPWLLFLDEAIAPPGPRAALAECLNGPNWRCKRVNAWNRKPGQDAVYLYGDGALGTWRDDIRHAHEFPPESQKTLFFVSWWCFDCLMDARRAAATFLREHLEDVPAESGASLARAAALYHQLAQTGSEASFGKHEAFLGPWSGKKFEDWTPDVRQREQEILDRITALDSAAIAEIDKALSPLR